MIMCWNMHLSVGAMLSTPTVMIQLVLSSSQPEGHFLSSIMVTMQLFGSSIRYDISPSDSPLALSTG